MKVKKYQSDDERSVLTGLIVNTRVLQKVVTGLKGESKPFRSKWSNQIYQWCAAFHSKYGKAPRGSIQLLFNAWAGKHSDESVVEMVEKFLGTLSDDYRALAKELNEDYLVDVASRLFSQVRYERLKDELEEGLVRKDLDVVAERLAAFHPVKFDKASVVDVLTDDDAWREAIEDQEDQTLIRYPGAVGEFFDRHLCREGFVSFLAPEKRGKTFWLIDIAWRAAVKEKRRTMFFSVGDMSKRQMMQRFVVRAARRPIHSATVVYPERIKKPEGESVRVKSSSVTYKEKISGKEWRAAKEEIHKLTASTSSLLKLECTSNSVTKVEDIRMSMDQAIKDGWIPDVVVIDYADILAPETSAQRMDFRHQTNETWKALRRLSQDYHVLVVTATQSDAASYDTRILTKKNFSEDKRKLSHVTGMVGINQDDEEKAKGLYRLNWILLREGVYYENRCVHVAGSLALANPAMRSTW